MSTPTSADLPVVYRRRRRATVQVPPVPSTALLTNSSSTPTPAPTTISRPDPPAPTTCHRVAPRSGMDLPLGVGPNKEIPPYGSTSLSCSILVTELHAAAKESLFGHSKEVILEEIPKLLCSQYDGNITQEPTYVPESIDARRSHDSVETMNMTPPHFSQMAPHEVPIPAAMKNSSPYLALVWQNESHITMIKLADDPSKQMEDFLSDNRASGRFGACYSAPIKSIQETSKSEILEDLHFNFDLHNQQDLECYSSGPQKKRSPLKKKRGRNAPSQKVEVEPINVSVCPTSRPKRRCRIVPGKKVEVEPTNLVASPTSPPKSKRRKSGPNQKQGLEGSSLKDSAKGSLKKRICVEKSNKTLSVSNNLKWEHLIDQAPPTDVCASPISPLKKRRRRNMSSQKAEVEPFLITDLGKTGRGPCDAANLNSQQDLKLVSSNNVLYTEKKRFPRHPSLSGSARTSINGWQWLEWYRNAAEAKKVIMRQLNDTKQSLPQVNDRAARLKIRNQLVDYPELANYMQMKGRVKKLRIERSKIHGLGVRAVNQIKEGDLIVQYIGEVIRKPICDMRGLRYEKAGICDYFFKIDVNYVIDATFRGGMARYINHSCEPNCSTRVISVNGKKGIFIYAKRLISAGEELTYNYYFPFDVKKIPCFCRSRRCHGSMN